jgi:uncharacterized protein YqeY
MSILAKIDEQIKEAMKAKDSFRLGVMRLVKAQVKNAEIELMRPLTEPEFVAVLARMVKQRKESVEQFTKGGRLDMAQNEEQEITLIQAFLPKQLSESEVEGIVKEAIKKTGAQGMAQLGLVMKELKDKTVGRVDGKLLADRVKAMLSK